MNAKGIVGCLLALAATVYAAPGPDDVQPTSHDIPLPDPDLADRKAPDGVPTTPPADGWWKKKRACPKGTRVEKRVVKVVGGTVETHACVGKGAWPRPKTGIARMQDRTERGDYWVDADGKTHGAFRERLGERDEHIGFMLHGVEEGAQIDRYTGATGELRTTYRAGKRHGLYVSALNSMPSTGYYADDQPTGTWLVWRSIDGAVKARLRYTAGELDGAQRWWFRDGAVLARGRFVAGKGEWEILGRDGTRRSVTRCDGRKLVETTAWDTRRKVAVHVCGPAAPATCGAVVGPTSAQERLALGADTHLCDSPTAAPLSIFD
jgi:hypothetical protein